MVRCYTLLFVLFLVSAALAEDSRTGRVLEKALEVLRGNRMSVDGRVFTCPSRVLEEGHPDYEGKQWLWDSCFHAMILAASEPAVAREELRSMVANQRRGGMVPHMNYFRGDARVAPAGARPFFQRFLKTPEGTRVAEPARENFVKTYWSGTHRSDITQPPVLAMAVEEVLSEADDPVFLKEMLPKLKAHYDYLADHRDTDTDGLLSIIHPWESGWDNSQRWDTLLKVEDPSQKLSYDSRKMRLVSLYKTVDWELTKILEMGEFQAEPVDFNVLYSLNLDSLARLCDRVGDFEAARRYSEMAAVTRQAIFTKMWDGDKYVDLLGPQGVRSGVKSAAMFYPMMLDGEPHGRHLVEEHLLNPDEFHSAYGLPTTSLDHPYFNGDLYWRGNVWINVNYFVWSGLKKMSQNNPDYKPAQSAAAHLKESSFRLLDEGGFYEFFNPRTGEGFGAKTFGWNGLVRLMETDSLLAQGLTAHRKEQYEKAVALFTLAVQEKPGLARAYRAMADSLSMRDRWELVVDALEKAVELEPSRIDWQVMLGMYQAALGRASDYQATVKALAKDAHLLESLSKRARKAVERPLSNQPEPDWPLPNHAILALGSPVNDDGSPGERLQGTLEKTLELARLDPEAKILVTGGAVRSMAEAPAMRRWLLNNGVNPERILMEQKARDTIGNAVNSRALLEDAGVKNLTVVSVSYHLPRALAIVDSILGDRFQISGITGSSDLRGEALEQRLETEAIATYRDVYRAWLKTNKRKGKV